MLKLDLTNKPVWLDLGCGVRVQIKPLTTALVIAARADPAVVSLSADDREDEISRVFAKALARIAIIDWAGVGDADGNAIPVSPEGIDALLEIPPMFEAFQVKYVGKGLVLEQEKNASAPSPTGSSAGAKTTAKPARKPAKTARKKSTRR